MFFRRLRQVIWFVVLVLCAIFPRHDTFADSFGNSGYGNCGYGSNCSTTTGSATNTTAVPDSTIQLSSGLLVAVNLQNGQAIPESGYTIVVTPLNGEGSSFKSVSYIINGTMAHTMTPASDGTASWLWLPRHYPGTHITIDVTGQNNQTTNKAYIITLASNLQQNVSGTIAVGSTTAPHNAIDKLINKLPRPVIYSFPYVLFGLLALSILVAIGQTYREVAEAETLRKNLERLRGIAGARRDFISLASHYLRTPITLLEGGMDMLPATTLKYPDIQKLVQQLHDKTETLLHGYEEAQIMPATSVINPHIYRSIRFWLPLVLAGTLAFCFDYLAEDSGALTLSRANTYTQVVIFLILVSTSYMFIRSRQLKRRNIAQLHRTLKYEADLADKREAFVHDSVTILNTDTQSLHDTLQSLPAGQATQFMRDGVTRLGSILAKCSTATTLKGASSSKPPTTIDMSAFLRTLSTSMAADAVKRNITIATTGNGTFSCTEPELLASACRDVLSNALTYAPQASEVTFYGSNERTGTTFSITDRGSGITKDKLSLLFEPFAKGEGVLTFNHEGAGLSLYLDKLIMLYLGGTITLQSEPGVATTVQLALPA